MTLNRGTLAKIDRHILSELGHTEGVQLVKVPVSDAVWSTWRRYCEAVGVRRGGGCCTATAQILRSSVRRLSLGVTPVRSGGLAP
jgi:hypothetical protein